MFGWGESQDAYQQTYGDDNQPRTDDNQASLGHEVLAGGASFAAFKAFEDHQRSEGKPVSHAFAKEALAGFAGAEVDRLAETKGMDEYEKEKLKRQTRENTDNMYDQHYGDSDQYDPNSQGAPDALQQQYGNQW